MTTFTVAPYLKALRRWAWLVVLVTVLAGGAGLVASKRTKPLYQASTTLMVNNGATVQPGVQQFGDDVQRLAQTYVQLIRSRPVLAEAIGKVQLNLTPDDVAGYVSAQVVPNTQLIAIKVNWPNRQQGAALADAIGQAFISQNQARSRGTTQASRDYLQSQLGSAEQQIAQSQAHVTELQSQPSSPGQQADLAAEETKLANLQSAYSTIARNLQEMQLADAASAASVDLVEPAIVSTQPFTPRTKMNIVLSAILGFIASGTFVLAVGYLDDRVSGAEQVFAASGYPTIGKLLTSRDPDVQPDSTEAEAYRILRTNLAYGSAGHTWRSLLVTSPGHAEGKSTVACNLAIILAQDGKRVALVDLDLRVPAIQRMMDLRPGRGVSNLLAGDGDPDPTAYLAPTRFPNLQVMTAGPTSATPAELVGSPLLDRLISGLLTEVDVVILDSPPVLAVTDASIVAARADATLLLVDAKRTRARHLKTAREALERVGAQVVGVVINRADGEASVSRYPYYSRGRRSNGNHSIDEIEALFVEPVKPSR